MNIIIVLNYNDKETTSDFLKKIMSYESLDKIVVVDNLSSDNSFQELKKFESAKVDVIQTDKNRGYGAGNNFGVKYAEKKYFPTNIIISNPDIEISDNSIDNMISFLNTNKDSTLVTGLILDKTKNVTNHYAWKLPTYKNFILNLSVILSKLFHKIKVGNRYSIKDIKKSDILEVDVVQGCFFIIKAKDFKNVNYFDEETFLYHEENILAFKLKEKGMKTFVLTNEPIIHQHGQSIRKTLDSSNKRKKIEYDSALIYLKKYQKISKFEETFYSILWKIFRYENYIVERAKAIKDNIILSRMEKREDI
ncbi:glycosyltransferase [Vagococcus fluvialis]|uniref:glycosyltransferase n=1 Tax=Vagococcus fluvialis TaxID=2738 RepID=UPI003B216E2E